MKLDTLHLFVDAMRGGNFTAVARRRHIDPSSVSRAIATLETDLGLKLFERSTRRFQPTEAARGYFNQIEPLLAELDLAAARARDDAARPAGRLRVTASVAFGCEVLSPLVAGLRARYPDLEIEFVLNDAALDLVSERIDLALRLGPPPQGDLVRTRLMDVRHRVCASPAYVRRYGPVTTPGDLADRDCVRFPFGGYNSRWRCRDRAGAITEIAVGGSLVISNALGLKRCVLDGLGPGLLADWMTRAELERGELIDLLPDHEVTATAFGTAAWILYPSRAYVPLKLRVFVDYLRERLAAGSAPPKSRPNARQ
jgi:DNA-binding transcriptional LysR family regulator